jgi:hypothetical protein
MQAIIAVTKSSVTRFLGIMQHVSPGSSFQGCRLQSSEFVILRVRESEREYEARVSPWRNSKKQWIYMLIRENNFQLIPD